MKISVVIITYNEEDRLEMAIKTSLPVADEIVVVDSFSTDRTIKIANKFPTKIFKHKFQDYGSQKNYAMDQAENQWVLNLDADERLSDILIEEITRLKKKAPVNIAGYMINRRTSYLGRWINHSGWYPDSKIRLFKKDKCRWQGRIHERLDVNGKVIRIKGDILHYTYRNMTDHVNRLNRYSRMQAEDIVTTNKKLLFLRSLILPPITFLRFYLWKLGILDGFPGFVIALISSWGTALKYLKAIEIKRNQNYGEANRDD